MQFRFSDFDEFRTARGRLDQSMRFTKVGSLLSMLLALFAGEAVAAPPEISAQAELGKSLFFDAQLSNPVGQSCASCHAPATGFTFPDSEINLLLGPVPGAVKGRFGNRKPPTVSYAKFIPQGPPQYSEDLQAFMGGLFWDGRATNLTTQATFPFQNPNEMNNVVHNVGSPQEVVEEVAHGPYAKLFTQVYGVGPLEIPTAQSFLLICEAIAAYEATEEVSPFSSKYDAYLAGKVKLSNSEFTGLMLVTGSTTGRPGGPPSHKFAQCVLCHGIPADRTFGADIWTNSCYANIGAPKNPTNPYYEETNSVTNPLGYNRFGKAFIDLGLGGSLYPAMGLPPGNIGPGSNGHGDFLAINGTFKAPTLRNVATRPRPGFVKCYTHNGVFKSLKQIVHFYNTRNLTTAPGEVIDFTKAKPYAGLKGFPLWPTPEYPSPITLQNPSGAPASADSQVGNLGLTDQEENDIVAFLQTLSDGFFNP